jgi:tetratricopeptide (TPR) repeat protein
VRALHVLTWAHGNALLFYQAADREHALQEAMWANVRAIELDGMDAYGYAFRGLSVLNLGQWDHYPEAIANARRAHDMNPNDTWVLRILANLEANSGEYERAIERCHQIMRLSPRDPRSHITDVVLAHACFGAKQYADGIAWASRALNDRPKMLQAYNSLAMCFVGIGEIDKAKKAFRALEKVASPEYVRSRLEGLSILARTEDRRRAQTFLRIAAGLEDPSAAEALR